MSTSTFEHSVHPSSSFGDPKDASITVEHVEKPNSGVVDMEHGNLHHPKLAPSMTTRTTWLMTFFAVFVGLGGWLINFDLGYTGIVLQMQPFNRAFGHCSMMPVAGAPRGTTKEVCSLTATQQSITSIYVLFMAVGAALSSIAGTYLGRRNVIQLGCLIVSIGAAGMLGSTGRYDGYIISKCIGGLGIGLITSTAPVYSAESAPAQRRGILVALYTTGLCFGSVCVSLVCLGTSKIPSNWSWKTPILLQIPVAVIYATGIMIFPESPRWLMIKGKEEKARKAFARFYNNDAHSEEMDAQIQDIQATLEVEPKSSVPALEIFQKKYRWRTFIATITLIGQTVTGINFVVGFGTIFLAGVGIKNPFDITVYLNLCIFAGALVGPLPCQFLGRRVTLLTGYALMASCMLIFAATNSALGPSAKSAQTVLVAFLCIWTFCFACFNASTIWLASAEQHSVRHRTYGQAFSLTCAYIFNFASNFWTPYMISAKYGNMGTNVGYFYLGTVSCYFMLTFFLLPETGNLTLEQIDTYYESGTKPWKTSLKKNKLL